MLGRFQYELTLHCQQIRNIVLGYVFLLVIFKCNIPRILLFDRFQPIPCLVLAFHQSTVEKCCAVIRWSTSFTGKFCNCQSLSGVSGNGVESPRTQRATSLSSSNTCRCTLSASYLSTAVLSAAISVCTTGYSWKSNCSLWYIAGGSAGVWEWGDSDTGGRGCGGGDRADNRKADGNTSCSGGGGGGYGRLACAALWSTARVVNSPQDGLNDCKEHSKLSVSSRKCRPCCTHYCWCTLKVGAIINCSWGNSAHWQHSWLCENLKFTIWRPLLPLLPLVNCR